MDFTFIEYFLVILSSSFIIFSLAIRSESYHKYYEFLQRLKDFKKSANDSLKEKKIKMPDEDFKQFNDNLDSRGILFKVCLTKVNQYVYHSIYFVFFLASLGLGITLFSDLDLFNIVSKFPNITNHILFIIHLTSIFLFYWYLRAIFVLILYTKIDYEYLEKLAKKFDEIIEYKTLLKLDEEKKDGASRFRVFCLKFVLFPLFMIFNKKFKEFFYKYYNL